MHTRSLPRPLVLLSLDWLRDKDPRTSLGHASLLARLRQVPGLEVTALSWAVNQPSFDARAVAETVLREATAAGADLAIGVYVWNDAIVQELLASLRRRGFAGRIILGGPQISYAPVGIAQRYPQADVLVRGYGEDALAEVVVAEFGASLPGVTWAGRPDLGRQARVALDSLPSPLLEGVLPVHPFMRWETQRGCPFRCSFCQHREAGSRLRNRTLRAGRVASEVDLLVSEGARDIAVLDPIFHANPDAVAILQRFVDRGYTGRISLQSRFEQLDESFLEVCEDLDVRLEFGLQTIHESEMRAVHRRNNLPKVERAIDALRTRGINFEVSLIYGLPTQTLASFEETVRWCQDRGVPVLKAFPLMLLRGTGLDRDRDRWQLRESNDPIPVVVESDSFSRAEWEEMRRLAEGLLTAPPARQAA